MLALISQFWQFAISDGTPKYALYTAFIVGQILTAINQGEAIINGDEISYGKAMLTFIVPYFVAVVNAVLTKKRFQALVVKQNDPYELSSQRGSEYQTVYPRLRQH